MIPEALQATIRGLLDKEPRVATAYFAVEDSSQGKVLTMVIFTAERREDRDLVAMIRNQLEAIWTGPVDVILLTGTTPPLYEYIVRESFHRVLGDNLPEAGTGFTEIVRRRAPINPMTSGTV